ncbi:MAG: SdrD B-like domain-containing protein [Chloroflexota bacterium]
MEPALESAVLFVRGAGSDGQLNTADDIIYPDATTDAAGMYTASGLGADTYLITFDILSVPVGLEPISGDDRITVTLATSEIKTDINVPLEYIGKAEVGDYVWEDVNGNHDFVGDTGEEEFDGGLDGITVTLWLEQSNPATLDAADDLLLEMTTTGDDISTTGTTETGWYEFLVAADGILDLDFWVQVDGSNFTAGGPLEDFIHYNGTLDDTILLANLNASGDATADFAYIEPATIGDFVWDDLNADGIQDGGEMGIASVTVELLDSTGTVTDSTTTDASGIYTFTGVVPGDYSVRFTAPAGYEFSPIDQGGDDTLDSDADTITGETASFTIISGDDTPDWDAGLYIPAVVGDFVWDDLNADGVQGGGEMGIASVTVELLDSTGTVTDSTTTDASGIYTFSGIVPGNYSVRFTAPAGYDFSPIDQGGDDTLDSDADTTTGETASFTLISGDDTSDWDAGLYIPAVVGDFVWDDLNADGIQGGGEMGIASVTVELLDSTGTVTDSTTTDASGIYTFTGIVPGDYSVRFTAPAGYDFSPIDQGGDDTLDSDADTITGETASFTLISGDDTPDWDVGLYIPAIIGDFVWDDLNADGIQDGGEMGIASVTVELLDSSGTVTDSTTTDASGIYTFTNVVPGNYSVRFTAPAGYDFSPIDQGGDDALDSDADTTTGETAPFTLISGDDTPDWDVGLYIPAIIGDFVWYDTDGDGLQDGGEPGIPSVVVSLTLSSGTFITTETNASGIYTFENLVPSSYIVTVMSGVPVSATNTVGPDSQTSPLALTVISGQVITTADFGYDVLTSYTITHESNVLGGEARAADSISFTVRITNTGDSWITYLPLRYTYDKRVMRYESATPSPDVGADDGELNWSTLFSTASPLNPGDTMVIDIEFTALRDPGTANNNTTTNVAETLAGWADPDGSVTAVTAAHAAAIMMSGPIASVEPLSASQSMTASVKILAATSVVMVGSSIRYDNSGSLIEWSTSNELQIAGFNILREDSNREFTLINSELIPAQHSGEATGSNYQYLDTGNSSDGATYWLSVEGLDGTSEQILLETVNSELHIYLPLMQ